MHTTEIVLEVISKWATRIEDAQLVDKIFVFGSLVYKDGMQFDPEKSDVDLLIISRDDFCISTKELDLVKALVGHIQELEVALQPYFRIPDDKFIVSVALLDDYELKANIHKDDPPAFWHSGFIEVPNRQRQSLLEFNAAHFKNYFSLPVHAIKNAQAFRNKFLRVSANGSRLVLSSDDDPIPKSLCRAAAQIRYFIDRSNDDTAADVNLGAAHLVGVLEDAARKEGAYERLRDKVLARQNRGAMHELDYDDQYLLWQILTCDARAKISITQNASRHAPAWRPNLVPAVVPERDRSEKRFIVESTFESLKIGTLNTASKIFPSTQWTDPHGPISFEDDGESERQLKLQFVPDRLSPDLLEKLISELKEEMSASDAAPPASEADGIIRDVFKRLTQEGSNAYPRLAGMPTIESDSPTQPHLHLSIPLGPSRYGISLVEEKKLELPSAKLLRQSAILNSVAVRVAYIYRIDGEWWCEFHRRHPGGNSTYRGAWDIGAAGYLDPQNHRDPIDGEKVSVWQAAAHELAEELAIPNYQLPHRDKYRFFGIGRNDPTGQLDILGYCEGAFAPPPDRPIAQRVSEYSRCRLSPSEVAAMLKKKASWVPTAILTSALLLRSFGFCRNDIEKEFSALEGKLSLLP